MICCSRRWRGGSRTTRSCSLLKMMLKATGKKGVPQGGVISPCSATSTSTRWTDAGEGEGRPRATGQYTYVEYARFADDLVILVDAHPRHDWLVKAVDRRLREELAKLQSRDQRGEEPDRGPSEGRELSISWALSSAAFGVVRGSGGRTIAPKLKKRTALLAKLKEIFRRYDSQPVGRVIAADQSDPAGLGELLCGGALEPVLLVCQGLGGEEGAAASDAGPEAQGLRLEEVE